MPLVVTYYLNGKIEMVFLNKTKNQQPPCDEDITTTHTQQETIIHIQSESEKKTFTNASTQTDPINSHTPETQPSSSTAFRHCNISSPYMPFTERGRPPQLPPRRNKLCRYWQNDNCWFPDDICKHAHGQQLLGTHMDEFWRHKERCQRWRHGYCTYNKDECFYLHC